MPEIPILHAVLGGLMMGLGVGSLMLFNGRIGGIGGAFGRVLERDMGDAGWHVLYLIGIVAGGYAAAAATPAAFEVSAYERSMPLILASGLLMGIGGKMSNGCTSGHGVCGIARLSPRSMAATASFFGAALVAMFVCRRILEVY